MKQKIEASPVGPVQIFEDKQHGLDGRGIAQESSYRLEEPPTVVLRITRRPELDRYPVANLGDDAGHVGGTGAELFRELPGLSRHDVTAQGLDESQVRERERAFLVAVANQGVPSANCDIGGQLLTEGCLADARL